MVYKEDPTHFKCCDICKLSDFILPKIVVTKRLGQEGLARGRKSKLPDALADDLRSDLREWRSSVLFNKVFGEGSRDTLHILPSSVVLGDDVIDKVVGCGVRLTSEALLQWHVRWHLCFKEGGGIPEFGSLLLQKLGSIYNTYDECLRAESEAAAQPQADIPPSQFYAAPRGRGRGS
jgi:hypothetical protein